MTDDRRDPEADSGTDPTIVAVPLLPVTVEKIDAENEREAERRGGGDVSREEFIQHAINQQLERLEGERWQEDQGGDS